MTSNDERGKSEGTGGDTWATVALSVIGTLLAVAGLLFTYRRLRLEETKWERELREPKLVYRYSSVEEPQTDVILQRIEGCQKEHEVTRLEALRAIATESYQEQLTTAVVYTSEITVENLGLVPPTQVRILAGLRDEIIGFESECGAEPVEVLEGGGGNKYILAEVDRLPTDTPCSIFLSLKSELPVYFDPRWIGPEDELFDPDKWTISVIDEYDPVEEVIISAAEGIIGRPFGQGE